MNPINRIPWIKETTSIICCSDMFLIFCFNKIVDLNIYIYDSVNTLCDFVYVFATIGWNLWLYGYICMYTDAKAVGWYIDYDVRFHFYEIFQCKFYKSLPKDPFYYQVTTIMDSSSSEWWIYISHVQDSRDSSFRDEAMPSSLHSE